MRRIWQLTNHAQLKPQYTIYSIPLNSVFDTIHEKRVNERKKNKTQKIILFKFKRINITLSHTFSIALGNLVLYTSRRKAFTLFVSVKNNYVHFKHVVAQTLSRPTVWIHTVADVDYPSTNVSPPFSTNTLRYTLLRSERPRNRPKRGIARSCCSCRVHFGPATLLDHAAGVPSSRQQLSRDDHQRYKRKQSELQMKRTRSAVAKPRES